jgi:hypothetical protein
VASADHGARDEASLVALLWVAALAACRDKPDKQQSSSSGCRSSARPSRRRPRTAADAAAPRPTGVTAEQVEAADAVEAWFKTLAAAARGSASDCVAMAGAIESVGAKGRPVVARAKEMEKQAKDPAAAEWLKAYLEERMAAGYNDLVAAMGLCAENSTVKKAMKAIAAEASRYRGTRMVQSRRPATRSGQRMPSRNLENCSAGSSRSSSASSQSGVANMRGSLSSRMWSGPWPIGRRAPRV